MVLRLGRAGIPRYREKAHTAPVKRTFLVNKGGTAEAPSLATGAFYIFGNYYGH